MQRAASNLTHLFGRLTSGGGGAPRAFDRLTWQLDRRRLSLLAALPLAAGVAVVLGTQQPSPAVPDASASTVAAAREAAAEPSVGARRSEATETAAAPATDSVTFYAALAEPAHVPRPRLRPQAPRVPMLRPYPRPADPAVRLMSVSARNAPIAEPRPVPRDYLASAILRGPAADRPRAGDILEEARALIDTPPRTLRGAGALACMSVSIYHEARDQPELGQRGVAAVILRRVETASRWGDTICEVVRPIQFSYLREDLSFPEIDDAKAWQKAVLIAAQTLVEGPDPRLAAADHYHTAEVAPAWNGQMRIVARIADHVFLRDARS